MAKFYTGKGDTGKTIFQGKYIKKTNKCFEALGSLDELNSYIGICRSLAKGNIIDLVLKDVQESLFIIQAEIGSKSKHLDEEKLKELEANIDSFSKEVGEIKSFVIPCGTFLAAHLDYCRALARRVERRVLASKVKISKTSYAYLNRISSLLFVLARYVNKTSGVAEEHPSY